MSLLAASGNPLNLGGDIQSYLALFNVPVYIALVVALLKGWLVTGREYDRVVADRDAERVERVALQKTLTDTVMPTNADVQTTLRQVTDMWMADLLHGQQQALPRRRPGRPSAGGGTS